MRLVSGGLTVRVWIDVTNSPHALFFAPIIADLQDAGHDVTVTARDYAQTVPLLDRSGIPYTLIGRHRGKSLLRKAIGLVARSLSLVSFAARRRFDVAFGHNSNDLALAAWILRIPQLMVHDYEHARLSYRINARLVTRILVPEAIPTSAIVAHGARPGKVGHFPGLKEHVYLSEGAAWEDLRSRFGVPEEGILVLVRPPATMSAYHRFENPLFAEIIAQLGTDDRVVTVVVPRTSEQREQLGHILPTNATMPDEVFDATSLIRSADLVVSAGGTMNREAAVLGTPAYTVFAGEPGAVDRFLIEQGLLTRIEHAEDIVVAPKPQAASGGWWVENRPIIIDELERLAHG